MTGLPTGVGLGLRFAFLDELLAGGVPAGIDFLELSPENYQRRGGFFAEAIEGLASLVPLSTHGLSLDLGGTDPLDAAYLADLGELLDRLDVPWHSDHLCFTRSRGRALHDLFPLPTDRATVRHVADRIRRARDAIGRPLAVENISYYLRGIRPGASDAEFLADVLEAADCGLLLDVNNVLVNATNHGFDPRGYLDALPLHRVVSIHVAGGERLARHPDLVIDTHGTDPGDAVLELLAYALARTGDVPVVYERDHAIPPLDRLVEQVEQIREVVSGARDTPAALPGPAAPPLQLADLREILADWVLGDIGRDGSLPDGIARGDLEVYRGLVRATLVGVVERFLPRTRACVGEGELDAAVTAWLAGPAPRSPYLRDVPHELATFLLARWGERPERFAGACDVLRHELLESAVEDAPAASADAPSEPFSLDARLRFASSVRVSRFAHRVHEPFVEGVPVTGDTVLLSYRDADGDACSLELSSLAAELVAALLRGDTVAAAVRTACAASATPLDDASLARIGTLLADLGARGIAVVEGA